MTDVVPRAAHAAAERPLVYWLNQRMEITSDETAFLFWDGARFVGVSWREYGRRVAAAALRLRASGVDAGDRVAIMAGARPEWLYLDLAAQSIGALAVGFVASSEAELRVLFEDAKPCVLVAETSAELARFDGFPAAHQITRILLEGPGSVAGAESWEDLPGDGGTDDPVPAWRVGIAHRKATDPIGLFYTSGTTGRPKGVMVSSRNVVYPWVRLAAEEEADPPGPEDRTVAYRPFAHLGERIFSVALPVVLGTVPHLPGSLTDVAANQLVHPTYIQGAPRLWAGYAALVESRLEELGLPGSLEAAGLDRVRRAYSGGAAVAPELVIRWRDWGVQIKQFYGATECGLVCVQVGSDPEPGVVGRPLPGADVRLAPDGEILVGGPSVFLGYWCNPSATAAAIDAEGLFHTGDIGEIREDGNLRVVDRRSNMLVTADGSVVPSSQVENALKAQPLIREAVVIGNNRPYICALVEIDPVKAGEWARSNGIRADSDLLAHPALAEAVRHAVEVVNGHLTASGLLAVRDIRVLPRELGGAEVTATRKIKRDKVLDAFSGLVDEMYGQVTAS